MRSVLPLAAFALLACEPTATPVLGAGWVGAPVDQREGEPLAEAEADADAEPTTTAPAPVEARPEPAPPVEGAPAAEATGEPRPGAIELARARDALSRRRYGDALAAARVAEHKDSKSVEIPILLGQIHQRLRRHDSAIDAFGRALRLEPENTEALYGQALALVDAERFDEALARLEVLKAKRPDDADVVQLIGVLRSRKGGNADPAAAEAFAQAAQAGARDAEARLGASLAAQGKYAEAAEALSEAAAKRPDDATLQLQLGTALGLAGKKADAEAALLRATQLAPQSDAAWRNLAALREQRGDVDGAVAAWQTVMKRTKGTERFQLRQRIEALRTRGLDPEPAAPE